MPNNANIDKLIAQLAELRDGPAPERFAMGVWETEHHCGAVACLLGWTDALIREERPTAKLITWLDIYTWLGITNEQADELGYMDGSSYGLYKFDHQLSHPHRYRAAIEVLTHLKSHNEVDWDRAIALTKEETLDA